MGSAFSASALPDDAEGLASAIALERTFAQVVEGVAPSVVGVTSYREVTTDPAADRVETGEWRVAGARRRENHYASKVRSGFIVSEDGYILTSHDGLFEDDGRLADLIEVEFEDESTALARLVGSEPSLDLAIIKVELDRVLPVAPLAMATDPLRVGQWAFSLGDPPGPGRIFDVGTISSPPSRDCYQEELTATLIQTSLRVQQEAWGGPMVDIRGRVIGIVLPRGRPNLALPDLGGHRGLAVPIEMALTLYEPLILREKSHSPWLGISVAPTARTWRTQRKNAGLPQAGIQIDDVFEPSPASRAGLQPNDVLTRMGKVEIGSIRDFQRELYLKGVGAKVDLTILRGSKQLSPTLEIEARPANALQR